MRFSDFLIFDEAAQALYDDPNSRHNFRCCLLRLAEVAKKDSRKGVAFKQKSLDDLEHSVFAQRLADKLRKQPKRGDYGDFLHRSVLSQGEVLGDMQWEAWVVTKAAMELGGVDPDDIADLNISPAQRLALVAKIDWSKVTLPRLKAELGPSFKVADDWKRAFGIERLKKIKVAVEQGQPITDRRERQLLGIWRTLEVQLAGEILPSDPISDDVGMTRLPVSPKDRRRLYRTLTGTNESVETPLRLSAQSVYDHLTKYGVEVVSDDEAKHLYLNRILNDLRNKTAFIPSSARGSEADRKRWRDSAARSWGGYLPAARCYDPGNDPGFSQWLTGMTTRGFKTRTNPSGRRVPYGYPEPEELGRSQDMPGIKFSIDVASQEVPNQEINAFYRSRTPEAVEAVRHELEKPARDAVNWLKRQGWIDDPARTDDHVQDVVMGMLNRTGSVGDWRGNVGFRRSTASMLARRYASQGWPSGTKERTGQAVAVDRATPSSRGGGEDEFSRIRAGATKAREVIQRAIASVLDTDTAAMGSDEGRFVDALDSLNDPRKAIDALNVLDQLSTRYERELPQVRRAVDRIQRYLEPLVNKIRA